MFETKIGVVAGAKTIRASEIENYMRSPNYEGWRIAMAFEEDEPYSPPGSGYGYNGTPPTVPVGTLQRTAKFLLVRGDENEVLKELRDAATKAEHDRYRATDEARTAKSETEKAQTDLKNVKVREEGHLAAMKRLQTQAEDASVRYRRMESDLSLIRGALGEIRMKEILAGKA